MRACPHVNQPWSLESRQTACGVQPPIADCLAVATMACYISTGRGLAGLGFRLQAAVCLALVQHGPWRRGRFAAPCPLLERPNANSGTYNTTSITATGMPDWDIQLLRCVAPPDP